MCRPGSAKEREREEMTSLEVGSHVHVCPLVIPSSLPQDNPIHPTAVAVKRELAVQSRRQKLCNAASVLHLKPPALPVDLEVQQVDTHPCREVM